MDLFEHLVDEHRLILRTLDALERFVSEGERNGGELDLLELNRFLVFFREFADLVHHEKEETILFPAMVKLGYAAAAAPIAHVRDEHRAERALLFEIRQAALRSGPRSSARRARLIGLLRQYIAFEREHIRKENELLYPSVRNDFSGQTLAAVTRLIWSNTEARDRFVQDAWLRSLSHELVTRHAPRLNEARVA